MSFFSVPLSGLNANQNALQSVSSNLANENTDGYKDQNVTFSDVFNQSGVTNGALDPLQTGQGVNTASTTSNFTEGNVSPTGIASNMALNGDGFFVMQQTNGTTAYSRAGDFTTNNSGQLVAPDGSLVLGYPAKNGLVDTAAPLQPLTVGAGLTSQAVATTNFNATINLDATTPTGTMATPSSAININDSLGASHVLQVSYTKTGANAWSYTVTIPSADVAGAPASPPTQTVASGNLDFDASGRLLPLPPSIPAPIGINIPPFANGAAGATIKWNLADSSGNSTLSQVDLPTGTSSEVQNGKAAGTLTGYSIQTDGTVQAAFSTGATLALGQVAVASVENTQGLQQIGNNLLQATAGSGAAQIGVAGTGGRGTIAGGSVEGSNVNVASEFSKLIVAQQSYDANAKSITTFNQVSQATIAMIS